MERFELGLPAVEMISDPGDLLREQVVASELSAQAPISFPVTVLDEDAIVGRGAVEEGQEPLRKRVDGSIRLSRGSVQWGRVDEDPVGSAFDDEGVARGASDEGGFDEGGSGAAALDGGGDKEARDMVLVAHVARRETFPRPMLRRHLKSCRPRYCLISW